MKTVTTLIVLSATLMGCASTSTKPAMVSPGAVGEGDTPSGKGTTPMQLGNFSVSLSVKDLAASSAFYEKLGFKRTGGDGKNYLIMQNSTATIGLFQGMFKGNLLTFNPGWDRDCKTLESFDDVRDIQKHAEAQGIALTTKADESTTGPASITMVDPDGNVILIDQHTDRPKK